MNLEYNTQREPIVLKEYGRGIQKMVNYIKAQPDKKKRTQLANELVRFIEQLKLNGSGDSGEGTQRIWDDLHIIADFDLDVDSPYPIPERETYNKKPKKIDYPPRRAPLRYGKNIAQLMEAILKKKDPKEYEKATVYMGRLLSTFHGSWSKHNIDNASILKDIEQMSGQKLTLDIKRIEKENLFDPLYRERRKVYPAPGPQTPRRDKKPLIRRGRNKRI